MLALPISVGWPFSSVPLLQSTVPENGTAPVVPLSCASSSSDWLPATLAGSMAATVASCAVCGAAASEPWRASVLPTPLSDCSASGATVSADGGVGCVVVLSVGCWVCSALCCL